jgi:hypothetical protein
MNGYDVERATAPRDRAVESLRALPGVTAASIASRLPFASDISVSGVRVDGFDDEALVDTVAVGDRYFEAVGIPRRVRFRSWFAVLRRTFERSSSGERTSNGTTRRRRKSRTVP